MSLSALSQPSVSTQSGLSQTQDNEDTNGIIQFFRKAAMLYQPKSRELERIAWGTGLILFALLVSVLLVILTRDMAQFLGWAVYLLLLFARLLAYLFIRAAWSGSSGTLRLLPDMIVKTHKG